MTYFTLKKSCNQMVILAADCPDFSRALQWTENKENLNVIAVRS